MFSEPKNYSKETYRLLSNCRLLDKGNVDGVSFVRCIPRAESFGADGDAWKASPENARRLAMKAAAEINEDGVFWSFNPEYGEYLRVNCATATFGLICQMKS